MGIKELIGLIEKKYHPQKMKGVSATYQFNLLDEKEGFYIIIDDGEATFCEGQAENPDTIISMSRKNFNKVISRDLNVTTAFLTRKIKVEGNMSLAMKLQGLLG